MWKELVARLEPDHEFREPASDDQLASAESLLALALPLELRQLLLESNGILGVYSLGLIWDIDRIVGDNQRFRTYPDFRDIYMPFDPLLFFGDAGNGDQFAFVILDGVIRESNIFTWNHEDDSRTWVAPTLHKYIEWSLTGRIRL